MPSAVATRAKKSSKICLVVLVGPTAVGKSEIALELAEQFNGEIVSADSRLFYRGMDIGTAKPTSTELSRVPHHLVDVANPDETWSLAMFQNKANRSIAEIHARGRLPFLVGGTGQFVHAIIEGWKMPSAQPDPLLRTILEKWAETIGKQGLHARLALLDPDAAKAIDAANARRTIRAMEVIFTTGRRFSDQRLSGEKLYHTLLLGLARPRPELYRRIDERISKMIEAGFIEEVKRLLDEGYSANLPAMSAIGYAELAAYLQGKISLDEAIVLMKRRTREFVRRQANWFKQTDKNIHWFRVTESTCRELGQVIERWMNTGG